MIFQIWKRAAFIEIATSEMSKERSVEPVLDQDEEGKVENKKFTRKNLG